MDYARAHRLLDRLAECTATPSRGVTRHSYSREDRRARDIVTAELTRLGLKSWTDWAGNLHSELPGADPALPTLIVGSHLDSVPNGGKFDGAVGVVGALMVMERFASGSAPPRRGVRFIAFAEEEGANFGMSLLGSRAFLGEVKPEDLLTFRDRRGRKALEIFAEFGLADWTPPAHADARNCGYMLELHVEQSGQLEETGTDIGVVDVIVADYALTVEVEGMAGHSGATPMRNRRDAMAGAAEMILFCEQLAKGGEGLGAVLTTGRLEASPNTYNCIAQNVTFTVDLRHPVAESIETVLRRVKSGMEEIAGRRRLACRITGKYTPGAALDAEVRGIISAAAGKANLSCRDLPSWAMHDAGALARRMRAGMIFIPSRDGLSHHPDEYTEPAAIDKGIALLEASAAAIAEVR